MWEFTYHSKWSQVGVYQGCGCSCSSQESCRRHTSSSVWWQEARWQWPELWRHREGRASPLAFSSSCYPKFQMHVCLPLWNTILVTGDGKFPWPMASVSYVSATDTLRACARSRGQRRLQEWDVFGVMFDSTFQSLRWWCIPFRVQGKIPLSPHPIGHSVLWSRNPQCAGSPATSYGRRNGTWMGGPAHQSGHCWVTLSLHGGDIQCPDQHLNTMGSSMVTAANQEEEGRGCGWLLHYA